MKENKFLDCEIAHFGVSRDLMDSQRFFCAPLIEIIAYSTDRLSYFSEVDNFIIDPTQSNN